MLVNVITKKWQVTLRIKLEILKNELNSIFLWNILHRKSYFYSIGKNSLFYQVCF